MGNIHDLRNTKNADSVFQVISFFLAFHFYPERFPKLR